MPHHTIRTALLALGLAGLTACTTTGGASGGGQNVPAGRSTTVDFLALANFRTCEAVARTRPTIIQPANGTVTLRPGTKTFSAEELRTRGRRCAGRPVAGQRVVYTPNAGYRGPDQFVVRISYEQRVGARSTSSQTYRVNVQ